jgi:1-Cys peroxiredoxin
MPYTRSADWSSILWDVVWGFSITDFICDGAMTACAAAGGDRIVVGSAQLTAKHKVATPVNWKHGEDVIIVPSVSDEEARQRFPDGWKAPKP